MGQAQLSRVGRCYEYRDYGSGSRKMQYTYTDVQYQESEYYGMETYFRDV